MWSAIGDGILIFYTICLLVIAVIIIAVIKELIIEDIYSWIYVVAFIAVIPLEKCVIWPKLAATGMRQGQIGGICFASGVALFIILRIIVRKLRER